MEIAAIYMIAAFHCSYSMPQEQNFRFDVVEHIVNNLPATLESVIGVPYSMQKSLTMNDTFFILTDDEKIFKLDVTGSIHPSMSFGSDLTGVEQLILLNNDTQILAVDVVMATVKIINLYSSDSPQTLLCNTANCCEVNDTTCFEQRNMHLGHVAVSPQNPYHLYFVAGSTVQEIDLTSNHPKPELLFSLDQATETSSVLSLDDDKNILNLVNVNDATGSYYKHNLTSNMSVIDEIIFSAPQRTRFLVQLPDSNLFALDELSFLNYVDIKRNVTSYVCADADLKSENATFVLQSKACQNSEKYSAITTDGEFVYVLSATGDLSCINYFFDESSKDIEIAELSEETTNLVGEGINIRTNDRETPSEKTTETSSSEWESIFTITLSTVLSVIAISIGCYCFITRVIVKVNRLRSKRQTLNMQEEVNPTPIQEDIELVEIRSQTRHRSADLDEIQMEVSLPQSTSSPVANRPVPPELLASQTTEPALELQFHHDSSNHYEQPLPSIARPLPPIPFLGPPSVSGRTGSSVSNRRVTGVAPPLTQHVSSPVSNYCDRTLQDIEEQAPESPRTLLDPSLLQAAIQSAYQRAPDSGNTSLSMTFTPQRIEINLTHQQTRSASTPVHDYLVINDVPRDSSDV